jgi:DNA invertase Pin-like site-specific DNA recombinase
MFHVIGAMAEFDRELIRERVEAGLRNDDKPGLSSKGNRLARPRVLDSKASAVTRRRRRERFFLTN